VLGSEGDTDTTVERNGTGGEETMWNASAVEIFHALCRTEHENSAKFICEQIPL
jgi:hypothetical protein